MNTRLLRTVAYTLSVCIFLFTISFNIINPASLQAAGVDYALHPYTERVMDRTYVTLFNRHVDVGAHDYWYPRLVEQASAKWFAQAVMNSNEYRNGLGKKNDTDFINTVYTRAAKRKATNAEQTIWKAAFKNRSQSRASMVGWASENLYTYKLTLPKATQGCQQYNKGGALRPLCDKGSAGHQRNVSIVRIPDTNIYVNRVWYYEVDTFIKLAKSKGYTLSASREPDTPSWMFSPGSWRSWDEQNWLYNHGYPANPPGKSMHEWGLAIDFNCNNKHIQDYRACWDWVRANGGKYNVRNFHTVSQPYHSEAWHFSPNGL